MKVRRGLKQNIDPILHLRGRIDIEAMLEGLGVEVGFRVGPRQLMCHCPDWLGNHKNGDANPSFGFNEEKYVFNCFVCGGGTLVELVENVLGCSQDEAVTFLEGYSNLTPMTSDELVNRVRQIMYPHEEPEVMPEFPTESILRYRKIHPYLYERGLTRDVIVEMQVGFEDEHAGILIPHFFQGKLRGWQVRHLAMEGKKYLCQHEKCLNKDKVPKYINTDNFPKKTTLYAYDKLKQVVKATGKSEVIVVESPFTALYLMSNGYPNTVATFGSFSMEQGMLLMPFEKVIFWPDNDAAGFTNAERARQSLLRYSNLYYTPVVPGDKSDAANLTAAELPSYLDLAYPASLFKKYNSAGNLASYEAFTNTNT